MRQYFTKFVKIGSTLAVSVAFCALIGEAAAAPLVLRGPAVFGGPSHNIIYGVDNPRRPAGACRHDQPCVAFSQERYSCAIDAMTQRGADRPLKVMMRDYVRSLYAGCNYAHGRPVVAKY